MTNKTTGHSSAQGEVMFQPLDILWGHRYVLLLVIIVATLFSFAINNQRPPVYSADGSLIYRFGKEYFPADAAIETWQGEPIRVFVNDAVQTEMEILGSRRVLLMALNATEGGQIAESVSKTLEPVLEALSIRRIEGTYVVRVTYESIDAGFAERYLQRLFQTYLDERDVVLGTNPAQALDTAAKAAASAAQSARQTANAYQTKYGLINVPDRMAKLSTQRDQLLATAKDGSAQILPAVVQARAMEQAGAISREIDLLGERQARLAELTITAEIAEETYRKTGTLANDYRLSAELAAARGPVIEILDQPAVDGEPTGLAPVVLSVLGGLLGFLAIAVLILLSERWKFHKAVQKAGVQNLPRPLADMALRRGSHDTAAPQPDGDIT